MRGQGCPRDSLQDAGATVVLCRVTTTLRAGATLALSDVLRTDNQFGSSLWSGYYQV